VTVDPEADLAVVTRNLPKLHRAVGDIRTALDVPADPMAALETSGAVATVVVVGEPKNGKSSLVNALVERAGLSPVDYAVATATYIAIRHGEPSLRVFPDGHDRSEEVHLAEIAAWTTVEGLAANPRAPKAPRPVEVTLPTPLLEHLSIIDTPGVGGFDGTHDRATIAALAGATSLLFCADGSRPLSEPELRFLEEATRSISAVAFVLTKVDQQPQWQDVLADNRAKVAERVPAFAEAPWFPVASPLAETALRPNLPPDAARALRERSGLDGLTAFLSGRVAAQAKLLVAANAVKVVRSTAEALQVVARDRAAILEDPSEARRDQLRAQQEELDQLASIEDQWRTGLDLSLTTVRAAEINNLDRDVRDLVETGTSAARNLKVSPDELAAQVNGALFARSEQASERILARVEHEIREIVGDAVNSPAFTAAMSTALHSDEVIELRRGRDPLVEGRLQPAQTMPLVMSGSGVFMLASSTGVSSTIAGWFALSNAAVPGVGLAVAATGMAVMFARRQSKVNERLQWVQARLAESRTDMQSLIEQRITTAKTVALRAVREWIRARQAELRSSITELGEQMGRDADTRAKAVAEARKRISDIDEIVRTCDNYIGQLSRSMWDRPGATR
jgi:hypothetical protein